MRDDAIRAYINNRLATSVCAENELESLGYPFAERVLLFCAEIVAGRVDHWTLLPFCEEHRDIPVYKYDDGSRCALIAVEDNGAGERDVSIMLACPTGRPVSIGGSAWDGIDLGILRRDFLLPRLEDLFP